MSTDIWILRSNLGWLLLADILEEDNFFAEVTAEATLERRRYYQRATESPLDDDNGNKAM